VWLSGRVRVQFFLKKFFLNNNIITEMTVTMYLEKNKIFTKNWVCNGAGLL
jgi:hypothetical protein